MHVVHYCGQFVEAHKDVIGETKLVYFLLEEKEVTACPKCGRRLSKDWYNHVKSYRSYFFKPEAWAKKIAVTLKHVETLHLDLFEPFVSQLDFWGQDEKET